MTRYSLASLHAAPEKRQSEMREVLRLRAKVLGLAKRGTLNPK